MDQLYLPLETCFLYLNNNPKVMQQLVYDMKLSRPDSLTNESAVPGSFDNLKRDVIFTRAGDITPSLRSNLSKREKINVLIQKESQTKPFNLNSKLINKNKKTFIHDENFGVNLEHEYSENTGLFPRNDKIHRKFRLAEIKYSSNHIPTPGSLPQSHNINNSVTLQNNTASSDLGGQPNFITKDVEAKEFLFKKVDIHKHEGLINVEFKTNEIKLLDDESKLNLSNIERKFVGASPFFQTIEFDPRTSNETGILLKILNYEFENVDINDAKVDEYIEENENENYKTPWYMKYLDINTYVDPLSEYIKSFYPLSKEEYNEKYPWDKFYDAELYYDVDLTFTEDGGLNMEMIPGQLKDSIKTSRTTQSFYSKKKYNYVQSRIR